MSVIRKPNKFSIKMNIIVNLVIILFLFSRPGYPQVDQYPIPDKGMVSHSIYEDHYLGWKVKLPSTWVITPEEKVYQLSQKGLKVLNMKTTTPSVNEISLLAFQKDSLKDVPRFASELIRIRTYPNYHVTEDEFVSYIESLVSRAYDKIHHEQPIFHNITIRIDGVSFSGYKVDFKYPNHTFHQTAITKIIRNYIFSAYWVYENEEDGKVLEESILHSKISNIPRDTL